MGGRQGSCVCGGGPRAHVVPVPRGSASSVGTPGREAGQLCVGGALGHTWSLCSEALRAAWGPLGWAGLSSS